MVGLGPGGQETLTPQAKEALLQAEVVVGYTTYLKLIESLIAGKVILASGMKKEIDRARAAVVEALTGKHVAVVSGGDPGVYGMAGPVLEVAPAGLAVDVIPGVTAATAAAALLGAPLTHDFAVISLSDLLTSWEVIERRLAAAAEADFVLVLYNPRSKGRAEHLQNALEIIKKYRDNSTPVGIVKDYGRADEKQIITTLALLLPEDVDMTTTVVIGNSQTKLLHGRMVTPRGYRL
ncbi:MAG: precorrin-3B C(17)-methyltransferase [Clostridium sp.]|nr:precorrin-3B C(17)-methyltransferase [Clostridium sp.]